MNNMTESVFDGSICPKCKNPATQIGERATHTLYWCGFCEETFETKKKEKEKEEAK